MSPNATLLCLVLTLNATLLAQQPDPAPSTPAATKIDPLQRAFIAADGSRSVISAAADQLLKDSAANRAKFVATVSAIAAAAPKPAAAEPAPAAKDAAASPAAAKPVEFGDATKQLMATVVTGSAEEATAALAKLAEDQQVGSAALLRLDERGKAILAGCVVSFIRKKMATNALYAGQYDELKDFEPAVGELLRRWAKTAPKDAPSPAQFRTACLRALRDVVPAEQATDAIRSELRGLIGTAQKANDEPLFLAAACALHQYGDASVFDKLKAEVEKQAAGEDMEKKAAATNTLADLHYQLRKYEDAANYYKTLIDLMEKSGQQPQGITTMIYNTACSLSLAKKTDDAFQYLEKALQTGATGRALSKVMIDEDHDMDNLRTDPRFAKLMEQFFGKAAPKDK